MAYAHVAGGSASNKTAGTTWAPGSGSISWTAGNLIVVALSRDDATTDSAAPTDTLTDNQSNTYTQAVSVSPQSNAGSVAGIIFYTIAATTISSTTVTFTFTFQGGASIAAKGMVWDAFSGNASSSPVDTTNTGSFTTGTAPSVGITPNGLDYLIYGCCAIEGPTSDSTTFDSDSTAGSWASSGNGGGGAGTNSGGAASNARVVSQYKITTGNNAQSWDLTISSSDGRIMISSFKTPLAFIPQRPFGVQQAIKRASFY